MNSEKRSKKHSALSLLKRAGKGKRGLAIGVFLVALALAPSAILFVCSLFVSIDLADLEYPDDLIFKDRNGEVLRHLPEESGERHLKCDLREIPTPLIQAFLAAEDGRFYQHSGYDCKAIVRASLSNIRHRRVVSGASTITQQLTRLLWPHPRTMRAKFVEILRAMKLERALDKEEILTHYLNRVPMGNNIIGVKMASQVYFDKVPSDLNISECALLAALPKAPGTLNPYHTKNQPLLVRRNWVLDRMQQLKSITGAKCEAEKLRPISVKPKVFAFQAPHLIERVLSDDDYKASDLELTLDLRMQKAIEQILLSHRYNLREKGAGQASALVVENETGDVLAYVGSMAYGERAEGYNDGVRALRSAGSTLKPFLYGYALDLGFTVAEVLRDIERSYHSVQGEYMPKNFDRAQYGPVNMRTALAGSLNLASISLLNQVGYERFYCLLDDLGLINSRQCGPGHYGLGLVIGNPEVTLEQLVQGYRMLANGGELRPLRYFRSEEQPQSRRVLSPQAAFIISDILSDPNAGNLTFGSAMVSSVPLAWKTGTSTNYRDCWIIGYTTRHTIGIWVGNFDGSRTDKLSGATAAGPLLLDICRELYREQMLPDFRPPGELVQATICSYSGRKSSKSCPNHRNEWFIKGTEPDEVCQYHSESDIRHHLPMAYAGWVAGQQELNRPSSYALRGYSGSLKTNDLPEKEPVPVLNPGEVLTIGSSDNNRLLNTTVPDSESVEIVYPLHGDRFLSEDSDENMVLLQAQVNWPAPEVIWYVNGFEYARTNPPYRTRWKLSRGVHRITAATADRMADEIVIRVE